MAKVVAEIMNTDGRLYRLFRGRMELVPELELASFYRATRGQIAKVLKFKPEGKSIHRGWQKFNYTFVDKVGVSPRHLGFGRASKTRVQLGCQTFMGKNVTILRKWALAN